MIVGFIFTLDQGSALLWAAVTAAIASVAVGVLGLIGTNSNRRTSKATYRSVNGGRLDRIEADGVATRALVERIYADLVAEKVDRRYSEAVMSDRVANLESHTKVKGVPDDMES